MTPEEKAKMAELEARVAELERVVTALKRMTGPNGETLQISGTNSTLRKP